MHTVNTDLVSVKTAVRQLGALLESEATFARQWASLTHNRGVPEAASLLKEASELLDKAHAAADDAAEKIFEVQEAESSTHDHEH
jgi:hypothetical protein